MIRLTGKTTMSAAYGGGTRFGSSITAWPSSGNPNPLGTPGASDCTIAVAITMGSGTVTFAPSGGYTLVHTERVLQAGASATPFGESYTGSNPCYISYFVCVAYGAVGAFSGTFSAGTFYSGMMARYSGVDPTSPVVGVAGTHRTFVGTNNPSYAWTSPFSDTVSVSGADGAGTLFTWRNGGTSSQFYPTATVTHAVGPMSKGSGSSYTVTEATYSSGSGIAVLVKLRAAADLPCTSFEGIVTDVVDAGAVQLSVASSALPDPLSSYQIEFFDNTTGNATPASSLLSAGPWTIGLMSPGQHIRYAIRRNDGAHINGSCVMRATDTTFGLTWDLTVQCTPFARQALIF